MTARTTIICDGCGQEIHVEPGVMLADGTAASPWWLRVTRHGWGATYEGAQNTWHYHTECLPLPPRAS